MEWEDDGCSQALQSRTHTQRQEGKLCCLLLVLARKGGSNHNPGKPRTVLFPMARAALAPAHGGSAGRSEDGGICNGTGGSWSGAVPCHTMCVPLPCPV